MTAPATPVLHYVPYDRFVVDVEAIAGALAADGWRPDHIVGVGRGGLVPATYLSHRTGIPMLSVDWSARVPGFAGALLETLAEMGAGGARLLFVDDINDSGETIRTLDALMRRAGGAAAGHRFAVLLDNSRSVARVHYRAREIDRAVDKDWFVFPWEAMATAEALAGEAREVPERLE
ncbi:MAG: phosphoribosyltransferase family protein [Sphingomonas sp.]